MVSVKACSQNDAGADVTTVATGVYSTKRNITVLCLHCVTLCPCHYCVYGA